MKVGQKQLISVLIASGAKLFTLSQLKKGCMPSQHQEHLKKKAERLGNNCYCVGLAMRVSMFLQCGFFFASEGALSLSATQVLMVPRAGHLWVTLNGIIFVRTCDSPLVGWSALIPPPP